MTDKGNLVSAINISKLQQLLCHLWIPILYVVVVLAVIPVKHTFEFDTDEGINLIKALLYSKGFSLYTEIWNDQAPLYTVFLSYWFRLFGQTVFAGRLLTLLFSALLLWSFYQTLHTYLGHFLASVGTLLLISSSEFIKLSVSVMIGIPSLSLAMLSIYSLTLYKKKRHIPFLLSSGCLLALSLQTKLFTVFLIPIMIFYLSDFKIIGRDVEEIKGRLFSPILLWLGTISLLYLFIGFSTHAISYEQLLQPHIGQKVENPMQAYGGMGTLATLGSRLVHILTVFAVFGILEVLVKKRWEGLFPLAWLAAAGILLVNHRPIWYHHYHLLSIPLSWLAAYGVDSVVKFFRSKNLLPKFKPFNVKKRLIFSWAVLLVLSILSVVYIKYHKVIESDIAIRIQKYYRQFEVVNLLSEYKDSTRWIFTDRPIYAFYADLPVPPEIAVFSIKRLVTGNLTEADLVGVLQKYQPEQVLLSRHRDRLINNKEITAYLNENYTKTYEKESYFYKDRESYYVLKSLL